ncbi:MAG: FeS-binding protein [Bacteroidetes bacterium HGW-Bacteroidetes-6]|jgi:2-oxoglutarate ferredoxin oxidoreductase subunit delta|nr:MAG: FeS-binding protein [Bacteroidetes bacterium HGW-Bacteroidetes-6]
MRQGFFKREHTNTAFVMLDTKKCEACWKCLDVCTNKVIGRINLPWHKHIRFVNGSACIGCMKCVKICMTGAISKNQ